LRRLGRRSRTLLHVPLKTVVETGGVKPAQEVYASGLAGIGSMDSKAVISEAPPSSADPTEHDNAENIINRIHGRIFFTRQFRQICNYFCPGLDSTRTSGLLPFQTPRGLLYMINRR